MEKSVYAPLSAEEKNRRLELVSKWKEYGDRSAFGRDVFISENGISSEYLSKCMNWYGKLERAKKLRESREAGLEQEPIHIVKVSSMPPGEMQCNCVTMRIGCASIEIPEGTSTQFLSRIFCALESGHAV